MRKSGISGLEIKKSDEDPPATMQFLIAGVP